jgi:hypothetical protein
MNRGTEEFFDNILSTMKAHFGKAAKAFWVYDDILCPGCMMREIDYFDIDGKNSLSINAYMYRDRGVMIAYLLCPQCAKFIIAERDNGPTSLHTSIEENLKEAYLHYVNSLNA